MKQQNIIQRLSLFLLALVLTVPALAQKERGGGAPSASARQPTGKPSATASMAVRPRSMPS